MRELRLVSAPVALGLALALLAGCGDRLVGTGYAGEPLATLSGTLVPTPGTDVDGPVRLALAWYPQWLAAEAPPEAPTALVIVTEDVEARGTFPADFRFPVLRPPPREALAPLGEGLAGRGAFGVLLAYRDLDGDRRLDPIPADGAPVDRVLASSLLADTREAFALVYVDSPQAEGTGLRPGFNLVQGVNGAGAGVVPLDTRLRLSLTAGGPVYDGFVCEAGWLTFLVAEVCGLSGDLGGGAPELGVEGRVVLDGERVEIELRVLSEAGPHPHADLNVNGRAVPYDPAREAFVLVEEGSALVAPGEPFVVSATDAGVSTGFVVRMPGEVAITAPAEFATVSAAAPLVLSWTASEGATSYFAGYEGPPAAEATLAPDGALSVAFDASGAGVGPGSVFVEARVDPLDVREFVTTALVRRRAIYFAP